MLQRLFPKSLEGGYRGQIAALWILGLVLALRGVITFNASINAAHIASTADGFPLSSYPPDAARAVVQLFGLLSIAGLSPLLFGLTALFRYRALVPLVFAIMLVQQLASKAISWLHPLNGPPEPVLGSGLMAFILAATAVGLVLSIWPVRGKDRSTG